MEHVTQVIVRDSYRLELTFDTGETRIFDATPYLQRGAFEKLKDPALFRQAYVDYGTVCWPGDLDIAPETLYDRSCAVESAARP
jgi:hypothetical protein